MCQNVASQSDCRILQSTILQKKSVKLADILHVDTNSHKLKIDKNFSGGHGQKWVWPVRSWDSKINCISKMNRSNALTFCMLVLIQENWQVRDTYSFTLWWILPLVEFAPVSGQTYLSIYMFNRSKISPQHLLRSCLICVLSIHVCLNFLQWTMMKRFEKSDSSSRFKILEQKKNGS